MVEPQPLAVTPPVVAVPPEPPYRGPGMRRLVAALSSEIALPCATDVGVITAGSPVASEWAAMYGPGCGAVAQQCPLAGMSVHAGTLSAPAIGSKPPGPVSAGSRVEGR